MPDLAMPLPLALVVVTESEIRIVRAPRLHSGGAFSIARKFLFGEANPLGAQHPDSHD